MKRLWLFLGAVLAAGCGAAMDGNDLGMPTRDAGSKVYLDAGGSVADAAPEAGDDASGPFADAGTIAGDDGGLEPTCGGETCRVGQSCVAEHCTTPCSGEQVPGDYATLQGALTALAGSGGTICLGPQTFTEQVSIGSGTPTSITVIGTSSLSVLSGSISINGGVDTTLQGFTVQGQVAIYPEEVRTPFTVTLRGMHLAGGSTGGPAVLVQSTSAPVPSDNPPPNDVTVLIDGCDVAGSISANTSGDIASSLTLIVQNSFLHASGVSVSVGCGNTVTLANNTFIGDSVAAYLNAGLQSTCSYSAPTPNRFSYYNNLVVASGTGFDVEGLTPTAGSNLFFDNTVNFKGLAIDGPGDLKVDPRLDGETPPAPAVGSPARQAADPAHAPATDYYGRPRPMQPDIGAVQRSGS